MKKSLKEKMYQDIEQHGANLNAIFNTKFDNITLCKKLRRLENKAHQLATDYCNGENGVTTENWDDLSSAILVKVFHVLRGNGYINDGLNFLILNGDARGYALKIDSEYVSGKNLNIYKDWGGYGIIAPDFTPTETEVK